MFYYYNNCDIQRPTCYKYIINSEWKIERGLTSLHGMRNKFCRQLLQIECCSCSGSELFNLGLLVWEKLVSPMVDISMSTIFNVRSWITRIVRWWNKFLSNHKNNLQYDLNRWLNFHLLILMYQLLFSYYILYLLLAYLLPPIFQMIKIENTIYKLASP